MFSTCKDTKIFHPTPLPTLSQKRDEEIRNLSISQYNLGGEHYNKKEYKDAIRIAKEAIATRKKISKLTSADKEFLDTCFRNLYLCQNSIGNDHLKKTEFKEAIQLYQEAIASRQQFHNPTKNDREILDACFRNLAVYQNILGCDHFKNGEYQKAIQLHQDALATRQQVSELIDDDRMYLNVFLHNLANAQKNLGNKHFKNEQYQEAIQLYQAALATRQRSLKLPGNDKENLDVFLRNLSIAQHTIGDKKSDHNVKIQSYCESIVTRLRIRNFTDHDKNDLKKTLETFSNFMMHADRKKSEDQEKKSMDGIVSTFKSQLTSRIAEHDWENLDFIFTRLFDFFRIMAMDDDDYAGQLCLTIFVVTDHSTISADEKTLFDKVSAQWTQLPELQQKCVNELTTTLETQKLENYRQAYLWQNGGVRFFVTNPNQFNLNNNVSILISLYLLDIECKYSEVERLIAITRPRPT